MIRWLVIALLFLCTATTSGQSLAGVRNLDRAVLVGVDYGPFATGGDLNERFGNGFALGGGVDYLPANSNWQYGLMVQYGFGNEVKEDVVAGLRTDAGFVIGNQRQPAEIALRQRQMFVGPRIGYTFRLGQSNQRSGLHLRTAAGYFYSRIRLQEDPSQRVPQLDRDRQAAYDRLAGGPAVYQFLGFQHLALDRRLNFYLGGEVTVGFTDQLREYDVATGGQLAQDSRTDLTYGLRAGLILPFYGGKGNEIFY